MLQIGDLQLPVAAVGAVDVFLTALPGFPAVVLLFGSSTVHVSIYYTQADYTLGFCRFLTGPGA